MSFVPVGIDIGTKNARLAVVSDSNTKTKKSGDCYIVSNLQGSRSTPAVSALEDGPSASVLVGDTAIKSLQSRKEKNLDHFSIRSFVRKTSSNLSSKDDQRNKNLNDEEKFDEGGEKGADESQVAYKLSSSFFSHLLQLVCDSTASHPANLKIIASVPVAGPYISNPHVLSAEEIHELTQHIQKGLGKFVRKTKSENGSKEIEGRISQSVLGIISEAAAVCIARDIVGTLTTGSNEVSPQPSALDGLLVNGGRGRDICPKGEQSKEKDSAWSNCLIINWGASGLSATVLKRISCYRDKDFLEQASAGFCSEAAGKEILSIVVKHAATTFERKTRTQEVLTNYKARLKLERAVEEALKTLGRTNSVHIAVDGFYEGMDLQLSLSRPRVEMLLSKMSRDVEVFISSIVKDVAIDTVLLSGSVSEMPMVKNLFQRLFPSAYKDHPNIAPDESVAIGCARYAQQILEIQEEMKDLGVPEGALSREHLLEPTLQVVLNPIEIGFGVLSADGAVENKRILLQRQCPLPLSASLILDNQQETDAIVVYAAEGDAQSSTILAEVSIPHDSAEIGIYCALSDQGELSLSVNGNPIVLIEK